MSTAPVLSTPDNHLFEDPSPPVKPAHSQRLSDEQLDIQYEISRTVSEIRAGRWKRIALQFPDEMLGDGTRVFERLRDQLRGQRLARRPRAQPEMQQDPVLEQAEEEEERLSILADTSYGACCVDEVAAEHIDAQVVVHYGRSCLSPTARLPVIYIFTTKPLDLDSAVASFIATYPHHEGKIVLMADIPYHHHVPELAKRLRAEGYANLFETEIVHNPASLLPNRTLPPAVQADPETLKDHHVFHVSSPPTSLLLILSSRVKNIHIYDANLTAPSPVITPATTTPILRRRYALLTRIASTPVIGILINTLSVKSYLAALTHCQDLIKAAGKKSYVFVVGKVNAAKVANFSEVGGWVVIGCWESSLIDDEGFWKPIITPFELEVALTDDKERVWGGEWIGHFGSLLERRDADGNATSAVAKDSSQADSTRGASWQDQDSDSDEAPDFDLRTGQYVSHSRPMGRPRNLTAKPTTASDDSASTAPPASSALALRAKGELATINGTLSPAAAYLKEKRTWQGLGSDVEVAYERDAQGRIIGAGMEEGRGGVAKGYVVGGGKEGRT